MWQQMANGRVCETTQHRLMSLGKDVLKLGVNLFPNVNISCNQLKANELKSIIPGSLILEECSHGRPLLLFITIWPPSCSPPPSSCAASATPEGHQRSSLIRTKYPVTKQRGSKLNVAMIRGFSSSVLSHAINVLLRERPTIILLAVKRCY